MWRALIMLSLLATPALGQMGTADDLQEQLIPESFALTATASIAQSDFLSVSYSIVNKSGMNLYLAFMPLGIAVGPCTGVGDVSGSLQFYVTGWAPPAAYAPAGARLAGTITLPNCGAPNPGFPTAPLSISVAVSKNRNFKPMVTFPLSMDVPIRKSQ